MILNEISLIIYNIIPLAKDKYIQRAIIYVSRNEDLIDEWNDEINKDQRLNFIIISTANKMKELLAVNNKTKIIYYSRYSF